MEKLDRLGWAAGFACTIFGVRMGIRVNHPSLLSPAISVLPRNWQLSASNVVERLYSVIGAEGSGKSSFRRLNVLYADLQRVARTQSPQALYDALESDVDFYMAQMARNRLFVHAGAVGWKGFAIVIPGRSHSGKTTLVTALLRAGATYYSDEFAVFDGDGKLHPFPRPLSIRKPDGSVKVGASGMGSREGKEPLPVGVVVVTKYRVGAQWKAKPSSPGRGVLHLLANTPAARRQPERALEILERVMGRAHIFQGVRGEAIGAVESILQQVETPRPSWATTGLR